MRGVRRGSEDAAEEGRDRYYGVHSKEVTVTYDSAKTSPEELIKGFGKIRVKAEEKPVK